MIKALLKSEWIKFRSYYLALGAALAALVAVPFFLLNLDYSQTAVGQTKALSEALLNILLNALEHADPDQKEVKLMVSVQQDQLVFAIWNNGPSFSEEMLLGAERLFYQSDQSRNSANPHHGIGLAFSKQVALLHGGRLTLLNPDQGGASVELTISLK